MHAHQLHIDGPERILQAVGVGRRTGGARRIFRPVQGARGLIGAQGSWGLCAYQPRWLGQFCTGTGRPSAVSQAPALPPQAVPHSALAGCHTGETPAQPGHHAAMVAHRAARGGGWAGPCSPRAARHMSEPSWSCRALDPARAADPVETIFSSPGFRVCPGVRGAGGLLVFLFVERVNNTKDI